jgi:hypothetical protein
MTALFGINRTVAATGATSGATGSGKIDLPAFVNVTPGSGGPGTHLTITSGPGWTVGDHVTITWGGSTTIGTFTADATGTVSTPYTVPSNASGVVTVKATDTALGFSPTFSFNVSDGAPKITSASISPSRPFTSSVLTAVANGVSDPDGDALTYHYAWTVNSAPAGTDGPTLSPSTFTAGASVAVTITVVDPFGLSASATATPVPVAWNLIPQKAAVPGGTVVIKSSGFAPNETVDLHLGSTTGAVVGSGPADATGFASITISVPTPLTGGAHMLYGIGRSSGIVGPGPFTVTPTSSISPVNLGAGDLTTFSGTGFVPGETVSVSFPGGTASQAVADGTGSVSVTLASPPEPAPGGVVTGSAPSGTVTDSFNAMPRFYMTATTSEPGQTVPVTLTGFGASESVSFTIDGTQVSTGTTSAVGSLSASVPMTALFGINRTVAATGATSGATGSGKIDLPAFVNVTPGSGPAGTIVTITSGPGWVPGETIHVQWRGTTVKDVTADGSGSISTTYTIPGDPPATYAIRLTESVLLLQPSTNYQVT